MKNQKVKFALQARSNDLKKNNFMLRKIFIFFLLINFSLLKAQFPGPPSTLGTTAMHKDSSVFLSWATGCVITRGYQNIANTSSGNTNSGIDTNGTKKAGSNPVVSLGDGGIAILTFQNPIVDGIGFDFAVFENSFSDNFLELAFVEVSSDGINYFRFQPTSNTQTLIQIGPFDNTGDPTKINNLAGKYRNFFGTPFDLQELRDKAGLDLNNITHVKIIDVVGCVNPPYATYDQNNQPINDPYPTEFGGGGFDLDAIGVINQKTVGTEENSTRNIPLHIYPNPSADFVIAYSDKIQILGLELLDTNGKLVKITDQNKLYVNDLPNGFYYIKILNTTGINVIKKFVKY